MKSMPLLGKLISRRFGAFCGLSHMRRSIVAASRFSTVASDSEELSEFTEFMDKLRNYEKIGVPKGAGTDSESGFDLGRMRRMLHNLGNPHSQFKCVHIAGTKGKGSTAAFLSSILRAEGYSVGCYTSPHVRTIRERITLGKTGEPVSVRTLRSHFSKIKGEIEISLEREGGNLTHFEVFTALAFSLFAQENVDFGIIEAGLGGARDATNVISSNDLLASVITNVGAEHLDALGGSVHSIAVAKSGIIKEGRPVVLGGPFPPDIEHIIHQKALSLKSPVVSASGPGNRSTLKGFSGKHDNPRQLCDILLQIERDLHLFIELFDVPLRLLGTHQLQNAATATCTALCLREQGWALSDASIRAGLENAYLLGRNQILTSKEVETLGLPGSTILLDGAHTKESAEALRNMIELAFPNSRLVLVISMAVDKDHLGFAKALLPVRSIDAAFFTEVQIASSRSRSTPSSTLKDSWIRACQEAGWTIDEHTSKDHLGVVLLENQKCTHEGKMDLKSILLSEGPLIDSIRCGISVLNAKSRKHHGLVVVTGSLHIVSGVLGFLQ